MIELALALLVAVGALILLRSLYRSASRRAELAWRPPGLRDAVLRYAERTFRTHRPFPLVARVDRAYRSAGRIVLAELKTRRLAKVYPSDILELSAQRVALEAAAGEQVSDTAYVLVLEPGGRRTVHPVRMLGREEVTHIAQRRHAILAGATEPHPARSEALCRRCGHLKRCRPELAARYNELA